VEEEPVCLTTNYRDGRLGKLIEATERLWHDDYSICPPTEGDDEIGRLGRALARLARRLEDRCRVLQQLERITVQNHELLRLDHLRNRILGMAAHDLRNPVGNILLIASLLADDDEACSKEERAEFLGVMKRHAEEILVLLNNLLDVSRMHCGSLKSDLRRVHLCDFLDRESRWHARLAAEKNIDVCHENLPECEVAADPILLRQITDNLISNAVKFSPPGSRVTITAKVNRSDVRVEVHDEGPGITQADRAHLFQDFARLTAQPTGRESSTGLGLAIAKRLVGAQGGNIGVDSEANQGAVFWFTLRLAGADDVALGLA